MDSITNAELLELALMSFAELETQFQYWLSVTFALLVASFAAKHHLSGKVRVAISVLYTISTAIAIYRYSSLGANGAMIVGELATRGIVWLGIDLLAGTTRLALMILGTLTTLWFLYSTAVEKTNAGAEN